MSAKAELNDNRFDVIKWVVVALIVSVGVFGDSYFSAEPVLYRAIALVVLGLVAGFVAADVQGQGVLVAAERSAYRNTQGRMAYSAGNRTNHDDRGGCGSGYGSDSLGSG